jgi:hypothetical protein
LKYKEPENLAVAMIIGAPRSGTSILGSILDHHPSISTWVEPYYIWDHHFRDAIHDERDANDASDDIRRWIRRAFLSYRDNQNVEWIIDKSPRNCLKIPFVHKIFPNARYIFLLRDGRDTILSISHQWKIKRSIFAKDKVSKQWRDRLAIYRRWLKRRPTWQFRIQSLFFEFGPWRHWIKGKFLNDIRWVGRFGWGPRFKGWQNVIDRVTPLEFNAYQWNHCVKKMLNSMNLIPEYKKVVIKYEDLIGNPINVIERILGLINLNIPEGFINKIPPIKSDNYNKWREAFSSTELKRIGPIIGQTMKEMGYENDELWYIGLDS